MQEATAAVSKKTPSDATVQGYTLEKAMELFNLVRPRLLDAPKPSYTFKERKQEIASRRSRAD